jgi:hypothetical protein
LLKERMPDCQVVVAMPAAVIDGISYEDVVDEQLDRDIERCTCDECTAVRGS